MDELNKIIYILYGSVTGNGESIAHILEQMLIEDLQQDVYCNTLNSIKNDIQSLHTKCKLLIVICSTTGNGDSPENASFFWNIIKKRSLPKDFLKNIPFIVLGLGDTNYDKFCYMGKSIDKRLQELGGKQYIPLQCADASTNFDEVIEDWYSNVINIIKNDLCK